jgi:hypothetical protein
MHGKPTIAATDTLQTLTARRSKSGGAVELHIRCCLTEDILACCHITQHHCEKAWSTNLLERVIEEIIRRNRVDCIFSYYALSINRLVGVGVAGAK